MTLAGLPTTVVYGSTLCVTTDPLPTTAPSPTKIPGMIIDFAPIRLVSR